MALTTDMLRYEVSFSGGEYPSSIEGAKRILISLALSLTKTGLWKPSAETFEDSFGDDGKMSWVVLKNTEGLQLFLALNITDVHDYVRDICLPYSNQYAGGLMISVIPSESNYTYKINEQGHIEFPISATRLVGTVGSKTTQCPSFLAENKTTEKYSYILVMNDKTVFAFSHKSSDGKHIRGCASGYFLSKLNYSKDTHISSKYMSMRLSMDYDENGYSDEETNSSAPIITDCGINTEDKFSKFMIPMHNQKEFAYASCMRANGAASYWVPCYFNANDYLLSLKTYNPHITKFNRFVRLQVFAGYSPFDCDPDKIDIYSGDCFKGLVDAELMVLTTPETQTFGTFWNNEGRIYIGGGCVISYLKSNGPLITPTEEFE